MSSTSAIDTTSWVRRDTASSFFVEQYDALTHGRKAMGDFVSKPANDKDAIGALLPFPKMNSGLIWPI
jgi:hypothetical protein